MYVHAATANESNEQNAKNHCSMVSRNGSDDGRNTSHTSKADMMVITAPNARTRTHTHARMHARTHTHTHAQTYNRRQELIMILVAIVLKSLQERLIQSYRGVTWEASGRQSALGEWRGAKRASISQGYSLRRCGIAIGG